MTGILGNLRIVESSAFVAAPLCGMTLAQLGADVIRIDPIAGGVDFRRWPLAPSGSSLYWAGLNKGKRSIALDLHKPEGREIAQALITAPGANSGVFVTNFPDAGWLSYESLREQRADLIYMNITGNANGSSAVDYTVNCSLGYPFVTGGQNNGAPVNHVLPAWDIATGLTAAVGLLAAERKRRDTGEGGRVVLPLSDVALAAVGALGHIAESQLVGEREATGNYVYGAFGRDFATADNERVMIVAITSRQWSALVQAMGISDEISEIERKEMVSLDDEGNRFRLRSQIAAHVGRWCALRNMAEITAAFSGTGVCWGRYQTFNQLVQEDPRCSTDNGLFKMIDQPGVGSYLSPSSPLRFERSDRSFSTAPLLGADTDEILEDVLKFPATVVAALRDRGIVR